MSMNITESKKTGSFTRIKKCILFIIASVALIVLSLPVSFAYNQNVGSVNSPLSEPSPVFTSASDFTFYMVGYFTDGRGYELGEFHITGLSASDKFCVKNGFIRSSVNCSIQINVYDISTGTLLNELYSVYLTELSSPVDTYYYWSYGSIFAQINGNTGGLYYILPDSGFINVLGSNYSPAFVEWSNKPLDHNIYHSELSEPVADEYNSYFICNDRLYWLSYRANGLYSFFQTVELSSQTYEEPVSYSSSGSGTYVGQQNGFTEPVSGYAPYFTGSTGDGTIVTGTLTPPDFGQIDFVGVNQGQLRVNSNGQFTYNDVEVFPVSVNNQILNRLFDVLIYLTDSSGFKVWLCPRSDLGLSLVVDASLFCSVFDLSNGEYISSSFSSYTGSYEHAGFDFRVEDQISDVRCYGCAFYNVNNIPVGLSDVLWQYDLEFVQWRDSMLSVLNQIRSLLSGEGQTFPESGSYPDYAGSLQESDSGYSNIQAADIKLELNNALGDGKYDHAAGQVKEWIDLFSIPKIIGVCILALALGTVTLTLGKKKSD